MYITCAKEQSLIATACRERALILSLVQHRNTLDGLSASSPLHAERQGDAFRRVRECARACECPLGYGFGVSQRVLINLFPKPPGNPWIAVARAERAAISASGEGQQDTGPPISSVITFPTADESRRSRYLRYTSGWGRRRGPRCASEGQRLIRNSLRTVITLPVSQMTSLKMTAISNSKNFKKSDD